MSELSDISTESVAAKRSPTDNTMMHGVTKKPATSSSFSERVKNTLGNFFPFTMGTDTGDEVEIQEDEEDDEEQDDFESQLSLNSSTHENEAINQQGDWLVGPMWCGQANKQDHRWITTVNRVCDHDKFGSAAWEEQNHRDK